MIQFKRYLQYKIRYHNSENKALIFLFQNGFRAAIIFFVLLAILSCSTDTVFEQHHKLDNYSWNYFQKIDFDFTIENAPANYDLYIAIRYVDGVPYHILKTGIQIFFPDGQERYKEYDLSIRNKDGSYRGSVAGDIWDYSFPVKKNYPLDKPGKYRLRVHNHRSKLETPGIMEIGLIVRKSEGS
jgi:gliding motility-associated lipoprotein GldH